MTRPWILHPASPPQNAVSMEATPGTGELMKVLRFASSHVFQCQVCSGHARGVQITWEIGVHVGHSYWRENSPSRVPTAPRVNPTNSLDTKAPGTHDFLCAYFVSDKVWSTRFLDSDYTNPNVRVRSARHTVGTAACVDRCDVPLVSFPGIFLTARPGSCFVRPKRQDPRNFGASIASCTQGPGDNRESIAHGASRVVPGCSDPGLLPYPPL